jgi:outer membrane protein
VEEEIMKTFTLRTLVVAVLGSGLAPAQAEDLLEVYRLAQRNDMALAQAQAGYEANLERRTQGTGQLLPTVNFNAAHFAVSQDIRQPPPGGTNDYDSDAYSLTLTQPLFRMSNFAAYSQGKAYANQAEAELGVARGELMMRAALAYFEVLAAEDELGFARTEKSAIEGQLRLAERNFAVGNATVVDVHEARARYDLAAAQEVNAANDLEVKREALTILTRSRPERLAHLLWEGDYIQPDPQDVEAWNRIALERNPLIQAQAQALRVAEEEVARQRGGHYPTLDFVAAHGYNKTGNIFSSSTYEYTTNQVGVQLQVPLYSGGVTQSRVREAVARQEQTRAALEQTRRTVTRLTREAYLASTGGITRARALYQAKVSSRKALESTLIGYESGVRTGVDVLNAQRDLYRTERDLSQARYQYVLSMLRLKLAAGTLSEADLEFINQRLVYAAEPAR